MANNRLETLIIGTANEVAEQSGATAPESLGSDTPLFGERGVFDSLGLVMLIVAVEEAVQEEFKAGISLADERALSQSRSPFRTIGTLAAYAEGLLGERPDGD